MKCLGCVLMVLMLTTGCSNTEHDDLRQWMSDASRNIKGQLPPLPQVRPYEPVPYDAGNLLDPFKPGKIGSEQKSGGGGRRPDMDRPRELLESFPLESLKFVGVMVRKNVSYGLIQVDGVLHRVRAGNYVGQDFGVIAKISDVEIVVKELVRDTTGDWVEKQSALQLQNQEVRK